MDRNQFNINQCLNNVREALDLFSENLDIMEKYFCGFATTCYPIDISAVQLPFDEIKSEPPKGFVSINKFCKDYKFVESSTISRFTSKKDYDKSAVFVKNRKNKFIDPVYFLQFLNKKKKDHTRLWNVFVKIKELDPNLKELAEKAGI